MPNYRKSTMRDYLLKFVLWCVIWPLQLMFQLWIILTPKATAALRASTVRESGSPAITGIKN
jgi:hypothetical protein